MGVASLINLPKHKVDRKEQFASLLSDLKHQNASS